MPDSHRRLRAAQDFLMHITGGDFDKAVALLSEDVSYRTQGHNALAGLFTGRDAAARHACDLVARTRGTFETFKWDDWLVGEHHVVGLSSAHAQSEGRKYKGHIVTVMRFNAADEIEGITVYFEDQSAIDRFIGP